MTDPAQFKGRDVVARAFADFYRTQHQEFPPECRDADYEKRLKAIPTAREATGLDVDGFPTWYGFFAPAGTPPEIVARLEAEILSIMKEVPMMEKMRTLGNDVLYKGWKAFADDNALEIAMFKRVIERGDITVQR